MKVFLISFTGILLFLINLTIFGNASTWYLGVFHGVLASSIIVSIIALLWIGYSEPDKTLRKKKWSPFVASMCFSFGVILAIGGVTQFYEGEFTETTGSGHRAKAAAAVINIIGNNFGNDGYVISIFLLALLLFISGIRVLRSNA